MNEFYILATEFNSREIAVFIWLAFFFVWTIRQSNIRKPLWEICKSFSNWKIFAPIFAAFAYSSLIVFLLYKLAIWQPHLTKDTIYWFVGTAFVLLLNTNKATQGKGFLKKVILDNLKAIVLLAFVINLYTLNIFIELVFVPVLFFVVAMNAFAEVKTEYAPVKKVLDFFLSAVGIFFIVYAVGKIFGDYQAFVSAENIEAFVLPPILTAAFIPFLYLFALLMAYETLFARLGFFIKNDLSLLRFAKIKIFQLCHFNLSKLNRFAQENPQSLMSLKSKSDVLQLLERLE